MQHMKKLATLALVSLLVACGGPRDIKLSAMNEPENAQKLIKVLSAEERQLLQAYVVRHTAARDIDYSKTVKDAIEAQKVESASGASQIQ
jgi:hypothetical protein